MLVLAASTIAAFTAVIFGGRLSKLFLVRLRWSWLPLCALLLQMVILQFVADGPRPLLFSIHVATYLMAAAFIWLNRAVPGLLVVAAGAASNGVTITLNGGTLPASSSAMAAAHVSKDPAAFLNSGAVAHPLLGFLGDMFAWPAPLPFANVFSVGDVLIVLGAGYGAHRITGSWLARRHPRAIEEAGDSNADASWGMIEAGEHTVEHTIEAAGHAVEHTMAGPVDERS